LNTWVLNALAPSVPHSWNPPNSAPESNRCPEGKAKVPSAALFLPLLALLVVLSWVLLWVLRSVMLSVLFHRPLPDRP
jgi:hypothetical protein